MTTPAFDQLLRGCARDLINIRPEEKARIDRGLVLALNGAAEYQDDHWQVRSATDAEVGYALRPEGCECPDRQRAPDGRCKHYYAVYLVLAVQQDYPHLTKETPHVED